MKNVPSWVLSLALTCPIWIVWTGCGGNASAPAIPPATVTSLSVTPSSAFLASGDTTQLVVTAHFSDNSSATVTTTATYSSSNPSVATVNANGLVTAGTTAGTTTIAIAYAGKTAAVTVTVKTLSHITVAPSTMNLGLGGTSQITVTAHYSDSTTANVTSGSSFTSNNTNVATVSASGLVTASNSNLGSATITATYRTKMADVSVTVSPAGSAVQYIYSTAGTTNITCTWDSWGSGTTQTVDTGDATYNPCIKLVSGTGWGVPAVCQAFMNLGPGQLSEYTTLVFKIKTGDYTSISVKIPSTGSNEEHTYPLSSGTPLANGWIQMSIPVADFAPNALTATQFAILNVGNGAGTVYLTDIGLTGTGTVDTSALAAAVADAQALLAAHPVGTGDGNVSQAAHDAYAAAIAAASAVATGSPASQAEVTAALAALNAATADFQAAIIVLGPTALPPTPTVGPSNAIVIFSDNAAYQAVALSGTDLCQYWWNNGNPITLSDFSVGGSAVKKYATLVDGGCFGIAPASTIDASALTSKKLHIDVYIPSGLNLQFKIVCKDSGGNAHEDTLTNVVGSNGFVTGAWNALDIDLASLPNAGPYIDRIFQIGVINGSGCGIVFLDNLYFY